MKKTLKTLAAVAAAFGLAFAAEAKNYTTVLSQDFEDATTYTENMSAGSVTNTLFGTSTSSSGSLPGTPTQAHRAVVGSATGSNFYSIYSTWKNGNLLFTIPDAVTNAVVASQDYIVEFDYYLNFITTSTYSGLAIQGANGPIATFYAKPGSKSGESTDGKLYLGDTTDTELITQVKGYARESDPSSSNCNKYWMHVTIKGVNTESDPTKNGIYMTVVRNNMTSPVTLLAETRICAYDVVTHLFQRFSTGNTYDKYVSLDDVLVKTAVAAKTFTWTGADDNRWENASNWTVGGEATEFYPGAEDTVVIALENQQIAVSPNVAFGTFQTLADSTTFTVLFSAEGQTFTIPTEKVAAGKFSVSQPFTDSTELSGNIYTAGTRAAATYTWTGGDGVWNDATQWRINDAVTAVYPTTGDLASFPAAANGAVVSLVSGIAISGATIDEGATITYNGSAGEVELGGNVEGAGTLVLSNVTWKTTSAQKYVYIGVAIDVPAASTANFEITGDGYGFAVTNKFVGKGTIAGYSTVSANTYTGLHLKGNGSEFAGTVKFYSSTSQSRDTHSLEPLASSSNAVWRFYVDAVPKALNATPFQTEGTYYLGAVQYKLYDKNTAEKVTYEIGALDQDSYIESVSSKFGSKNNINWIAPNATFTCAVSNVNILATLGGGTIVIASEGTLPTGRILFSEKGGTLKTAIVDGVKIDPSSKFTKCNAPICFDDEGVDYTWATAITNNNTGGLTKKGTGTLTIKKVALNGALQVLGGKIAVDEELTGDVQTLLSWDVVDGAEEVTLDDFDLTAVSAGLDYAVVTNGTKVSLEIVRTPSAFTYAGGTEGIWTNANTWKIGDTTVPFYPIAGDTVTIGENVTITTVVGQVVKALTIGTGSKLAFDLTDIAKNESVTLFTVSDGASMLTTDNIVLTGYADTYKPVLSVGATAVTVGLYDKTKFVWTGAAGDKLFETTNNWVWGAAGGPVAETAPTSTSTLTIGANQTVIVKPDQGFGTVTADATTTLAVLFTADAQTFTAPEGYAGKVSALGPFTVTETVPYTATRVASTFTWVGASGDWATASNWAVGGNPTGVGPGANDNAIFDDDADGKTIQFNANAAIATNFFGNAHVQFSNEFEFRVDITTNLAGKAGTMVLTDTVHLRSGSTAGTGCYYVDIEVPEDESAYIELTSTAVMPKVYGAIRGNGTLYLKNNNSQNYYGPEIFGDMSDFEGTVEVVEKNGASGGGAVRNNTKLHDGDGDGWFYASNAVWNVYNTQVDNILDKDVCYSFGALNGRLYQANSKSPATAGLIEVGALNQDCEVSGQFYYTPVRKIGSATFACGADNIGNVEIVDGTYKLLNNTQKGTITFSGGTFVIATNIEATIDFAKKFVASTAAMIVDIGTSNRTWATAIPASNEGGFTKKGAATLTLEASPLYSGKTTVDAGTFVLPKGTALNGALCVTDGSKIGFTEALTGDDEILLSWDYDAEATEVTTNDFTIAVPSTAYLAITTNDSTVALSMVRIPAAYGYSGSTDGLWSDPKNWTVDEATADFAPGVGDTATIGADLTVTTSVGQVVQTLTLGANSKLAFDLTDVTTFNTPVTLFTTSDGSCPLMADNVLLKYDATKYAVVTTQGSTSFMVTLYDKSVFVWTGDGDDNLFDTVGNWVYGAEGGPAAETYPNIDSTLIFPAKFTDGVVVDIDGNYMGDDKPGYRCDMTLNCNVTLQSVNDKTYIFAPGTITGSGSLTLDKIQLRKKVDGNMVIDSDLVVNTSAGLYIRGGSTSITVNGAVSGSGTLTLEADSNSGKNLYINGDMSAFAGTLSLAYKEATIHLGGDDDTIDLSQATLNINDERSVRIDGTYTNNVLKVGALTGGGTIYNATANAMTLQVGSAADAESSVALSPADGDNAWTIKKVGTGCQTFSNTAMTNSVDLSAGELGVPTGSHFYDVARNGGKFKFEIPYDSPWTNGTAQALFTCTDGLAAKTEVNYVTLDFSAFKTVYEYTFDNTEANTLKITLTPSTKIFVWQGPNCGLWSDATNWVAKGTSEHPLVAPGIGSPVEIGANAVIVVDPGQSFGTVSADATAKLVVMFTEAGQKFTAPTEFAGTIVAAGPFEMDAEGTATRVPSTFTWVGADGNWSDVANWKVNDLPTAVLPAQNDSIVFPAALNAVAVTIDANSYASNVWTDAQLTLSGDSSYKLYGNFYRGSGKIVMNGVQLGAQLSEDMIISNNIEVAANSENTIWLAEKRKCETIGNITGSGLLQWDCQNNAANISWHGMYFRGTNTAFAGTFKQLRGVGGRSGMGADSWAATSSNAVWLADSRANNNTDSPFFPTGANGTYYFGAIQGGIQGGWASPSFEIGNRDDYESDFMFLGRTSNGKTTSCSITKVGSANLIVRCAGVGDNGTPSKMLGTLTLKGGTTWVQYVPTTTLTFAGDGATLQMNTNGTDNANALLLDPSAVIKNSSSAICFDDGGTNATWTAQLAASNEGGLIKKGAGTLTLIEEPKYTGDTVVEAGKLVLTNGTVLTGDLAVTNGAKIGFISAISDADKALLTWNATYGNLHVKLDDFEVTGTLPEGSALNLVVEGDTAYLKVSSVYTWTGNAGNNLWSDAGNWSAGGEAASGAPSVDDVAQITNAKVTVVVTENQEFGRLIFANDTKMRLLPTTGTEATQVFTLPKLDDGSFFPADRLEVYGPYETEVVDGVVYATRVPSTFVWTDAQEDHQWNTTTNWTVNNLPTAVLPGAADTVEFPSLGAPWEVVLATDAYVTNAVFAGDTLISNSLVHATQFNGAGMLTLGDNGGFADNGAELRFTNALQIVASEEAPARIYRIANTIDLRSTVTGSGTVRLEVEKDQGDIALNGDLTDFEGLVIVPSANQSANRNNTYLNKSNASSAKARWRISCGFKNHFLRSVATYYFGSLDGTLNQNNQSVKNPVVEIGALNRDSTLGGRFFAESTYGRLATYATTVRKVGTGALYFNGYEVRDYEINAGSLIVSNDYSFVGYTEQDSPNKYHQEYAEGYNTYITAVAFKGDGGTLVLGPNVTWDVSTNIVNSTAAISIDDGGVNRTWATALNDSNEKHEIVKDGWGTLTMSAKPAWDLGTDETATKITVKSGKLILPKDAWVTLGTETQSNLITIAETEWLELKPADSRIAVTPSSGGNDFTVIVPQDWVADKMVGKAADTNGTLYTQTMATHALSNATETVNGIAGWECYVLGLEPSVKTSIPLVTPQQGTSTNTVTLNLSGIKVEEKAGVAVKYAMQTATKADFSDKSEGTAQTETAFEVDLPKSGVKYYRVNVKFDQSTND